jgi:hypothetical protein
MVGSAVLCLAVVVGLKRSGRFLGVDGPTRFLGAPTPMLGVPHVPGPDPREEVAVR